MCMRPHVALLVLTTSLSVVVRAEAASGDWRQDTPGQIHRIDPRTLPAPYATAAAGNPPDLIDRPEGAHPSVPPGFQVQPFAEVRGARAMRVATNGDVFVSSTETGRILVLKTQDRLGRALGNSVFASGLHQPFGMAFWPIDAPRYIYVAQIDRLIRYPWHIGATVPDGPPETILDHLPTGGHWTRDVVVAPSGSRLLLSIGSGSNDAEEMGAPPKGFIESHPVGATWGAEQHRADVLTLAPDGSDVQIYATGLRNCSGEAIEPSTGVLWCATNERDGLGDDLPPDYLTSVRQGGYYGWPWYYIGSHPDPDHASARPDLVGKGIVPDVLIQPHSAPLGITFYSGAMFPTDYRGRGFAALHGSWDRATRTGYKVVSFQPGSNAYTDFLTGFIRDNSAVWGRPVDVAVAHDGALLVSDDAGGVIWRVSH